MPVDEKVILIKEVSSRDKNPVFLSVPDSGYQSQRKERGTPSGLLESDASKIRWTILATFFPPPRFKKQELERIISSISISLE